MHHGAPGSVHFASLEEMNDESLGLTERVIRENKDDISVVSVQDSWYYNDPDHPGKAPAQGSDEKLGTALWDLSHRIITDKLGEMRWSTD